MKATLELDRILRISVAGDTEIGAVPPGVGLERLRFDGRKVVDLADLKSLWVRDLGCGAYSLHAVEVPGSQAVEMTYADRRRLTTEAGVIRLRTQDEMQAQNLAEALGMEKNRLRRRIQDAVGDQADQLADLYKLVYALIAYVLTADPASAALLRELLPDIQACYPAEDVAKRLKAVVPSTAIELKDYYDRKADLQEKPASETGR